MIGDTKWDIEAAAKLGVPTVCVLTGGWSRQELLGAGAVDVYESVNELRERARRDAARELGGLLQLRRHSRAFLVVPPQDAHPGDGRNQREPGLKKR